MIRTFKRKLKPTKAQRERITRWIGACRCVYNLGLEIRIAAWKNQRRSVSAYELMKQLPELKEECPWIRDVPSQSLQAVLERLERSYQTFFKGGGFPRWASKKKYRSMQIKSLHASGHSVILPKMGRIRMFKDAPVTGTPKTAQIIIEPNGLFICILCELPDPAARGENQAVGLDLGLSHFCVLSDGSMVENPKLFEQHRRRLRRANRSLARKKKGSHSWKKQVRRLARLYYRMRCERRDFLHKVSTRLAGQFSTVYVEELNILGMVRDKQLSRGILDSSWGTFLQLLTYKTHVVKVNPRHTSQTCHRCGTVDAESRVSRSIFVCKSCGYTEHADVNAAKNIWSRGAALVRKRSALAQA